MWGFRVGIGLSLLLLFVVNPVASAAPPPVKNVVLFIADDLGFQLGCYGDKLAQTPHLDALAARGTRFTRAFASVASCSPSRATILTGLPTHQCGQYGLAHATHNSQSFRNVKSLPGWLKAKNIWSAAIAKLHVGPEEVYPFDQVLNVANNRDPVALARRFQDAVTNAAGKPFFIQVGFVDPHRAARGFGNEGKFAPETPRYRPDPKSLTLPDYLPDQPEVRQEFVEYYQAVTRMDDAIGRMLAILKAQQLDESTLILFISDNGIPFPGAKTTLYDSGVHLPLLVVKPGQKPTVNEAMVSWTDIAPTILDWFGIPKPPALRGTSWLPILEQPDDSNRKVVFGSHQFHEVTMYYPMRMIRTRDYKLIENLASGLEYPHASDLWDSPTWQGILKRNDPRMGQRETAKFLQRPRWELYDLRTDPQERLNLADRPDQQETFRDLQAQLLEWRRATNDPWIIKQKHE